MKNFKHEQKNLRKETISFIYFFYFLVFNHITCVLSKKLNFNTNNKNTVFLLQFETKKS